MSSVVKLVSANSAAQYHQTYTSVCRVFLHNGASMFAGKMSRFPYSTFQEDSQFPYSTLQEDVFLIFSLSGYRSDINA